MSEFLALLGIKLKIIVPGICGAAVSLRFYPDVPAQEKFLTFLGGVVIAVYCTTAVVEWLELKESMETAMAILLGLLGMGLAEKSIRVIREMDWRDLFKKGG